MSKTHYRLSMIQKNLIIRNASIGLISQIMTLMLSFISRIFFLKYIGVEILGLSGTLTSVISALSLVDLGIYSAVVFRLYNPLINQRYEECSEILNVLKYFLRSVAVIIFCLFVFTSFILKYILKGVEITAFVYLAYALFCVNSVISYFLAYKRTLLYADGKDSVAKAVDSLCNLCFTGFRLIAIIVSKNFLIYQGITIVQTIVSNFIIHFYCKKKYLWLHSTTLNRTFLKLLISDTKNIFVSKIAGYIHGATDNLVISIFLNTSTVGFYSNYFMLQASLKMLFDSITAQITPFIGREYANTADSSTHKHIITNYTFIRYLLAGFFIVPFYCLANNFISLWVGLDYVIQSLPLFFSIELYIHIIHSLFTDYEVAAGAFNKEKKISIIGAVINIVTSIILVNILGLSGVILGTCISQLFYWFFRGKLVLKNIFKFRNSFILKYIVTNFAYAFIIILSIFIAIVIMNSLEFENSIPVFILNGIICELLFFLLTSCCLFWTVPYKYFFKNLFKQRLENDE